jgi:hypothetical protein
VEPAQGTINLHLLGPTVQQLQEFWRSWCHCVIYDLCMQECSSALRYMQHAARSDLLQCVLADIAASKARRIVSLLRQQHKAMQKKLGKWDSTFCNKSVSCHTWSDMRRLVP